MIRFSSVRGWKSRHRFRQVHVGLAVSADEPSHERDHSKEVDLEQPTQDRRARQCDLQANHAASGRTTRICSAKASLTSDHVAHHEAGGGRVERVVAKGRLSPSPSMNGNDRPRCLRRPKSIISGVRFKPDDGRRWICAQRLVADVAGAGGDVQQAAGRAAVCTAGRRCGARPGPCPASSAGSSGRSAAQSRRTSGVRSRASRRSRQNGGGFFASNSYSLTNNHGARRRSRPVDDEIEQQTQDAHGDNPGIHLRVGEPAQLSTMM